MALPSIVRYAGRLIYKDAKGRFTSKSNYERLIRRSPRTGRFGKAGAANIYTREAENALRDIIGAAPPPGQDWVRIADKYEDRFGDQLRELRRRLS